MIGGGWGGRLPQMGLSERDQAILDFERGWWSEPGPKGGAVRARLGLSATRYYELLSALVDSSDAATYDPLLVRRLRRERYLRRRARFEGRYVGGRPSR